VLLLAVQHPIFVVRFGRAHFESDLSLDEEYVGGVDGEVVALAFGADGADVGGSESSSSPCDAICGGVLSSEMLHHVFLSLTMELRATASAVAVL
jgi:hypothetical protein